VQIGGATYHSLARGPRRKPRLETQSTSVDASAVSSADVGAAAINRNQKL